jgi:hypothetical protein
VYAQGFFIVIWSNHVHANTTQAYLDIPSLRQTIRPLPQADLASLEFVFSCLSLLQVANENAPYPTTCGRDCQYALHYRAAASERWTKYLCRYIGKPETGCTTCMRSIFFLWSLLAFIAHQRVTFPYKEEAKILRMCRCPKSCFRFPVFLCSNTSSIICTCTTRSRDNRHDQLYSHSMMHCVNTGSYKTRIRIDSPRGGLTIMAMALALQCAKSVEITLPWKTNKNVA